MINQATHLNHQKTALADGFSVTVGGNPSNVSPPELMLLYHQIRQLSKKITPVDRTGFEPAPSGGEPDSLPLTYRPKFTEAAELLQTLSMKVKL